MNVLREMGCSVAKVSVYPQFLRNRKGKVFGYGMLLITLYFLIAYLIPTGTFMMRLGGVGRLLEEYVPDFALSNGTLWVEEAFYFDEEGVYLDVDTDLYFDLEAAEEFAKGYTSVIILDAEKCFFKGEGTMESMYYADLGDVTFSRSDLLGLVPAMYAVMAVVYVFLYLWIVGLFFFGVIFVALLGLILGSVLRVNLTFGQMYMLGIYSRTLSLAIKALVKMIGLTVPMFWVINFGLSAVYLYLALKQIRRQQEEAYQIQQEQAYRAQQMAFHQDQGQQETQMGYDRETFQEWNPDQKQ